MIFDILLLLLGLATLLIGAELLVRGASSLAAGAGVPPLVIGLTIVAFGTSTPELIVNLNAALQNQPAMALGNIIGSSIANILLILGLSGCYAALSVQHSTTTKEVPLALLAVVALMVLAGDSYFDADHSNVVTRGDGLILILFFLVFLYYSANLAFQTNEDETSKIARYSGLVSAGLVILGLVGLYFGGEWIVSSSVALARAAGLSELFIGSTILAVGTSLPELATSLLAVRRGQYDIAVGNVVGSNIFNIFFILGITAVVQPLEVSSAVGEDLFICLAATGALFAALFVGTRHRLDRWQGLALLVGYVGYILMLVQREA